MAKNAVIIGGGVGGLSAAIHLAARGVHVTLLEKNPRIGGKLNVWAAAHPKRPSDRPFRFDTGPTVLTLPLVFQDLFAAAKEDVRDYLPIQRLDPIARYTWSDGTTFTLRADEQDRLREVRRFAPDDVDGFQRLLRRGESIWNLSADTFLSHAPEQLLRAVGFSPMAGLKLLTTPLRIGMFGNFASLIDRHIKSQKLREVLYQYATYVGASPFKAPATMAVIPFVEMGFGAWYIPGGMYKLAEALEAVARKLGVDIHTNCDVAQILVEPVASVLQHAGSSTRDIQKPGVLKHTRQSKGPRATGVQTRNGVTFQADCVVANSDVVYTYRHLIDARYRKRYSDPTLDKIEPGASGLVLLLGIDGTYPQLAHHNKFMPDEYASDPTAVFETHTIPAEPCIYVCASTRSDPTQAPEGCESLFIFASAPALPDETGTRLISAASTIDWQNEGPRYRNRLIHTLETRCGLTDLSKRIVVERMITPMNLRSLYNANAGTIYGTGSNSRRSALLRPPNRDRDIAGLYFAGGATHPGGGLPLVALSGKIVAELVAEDLGLTG